MLLCEGRSRRIKEYVPILFLQKGASFDIKDKDGNTPYGLAIRESHDGYVSVVVDLVLMQSRTEYTAILLLIYSAKTPITTTTTIFNLVPFVIWTTFVVRSSDHEQKL